jgi:hypothetical protein
MLVDWWSRQAWPAVPPEALPATGRIVADLQGRPICAGFMYRTDSSIAWVEWTVADPETPAELRSEALDLLIGTLETEAKSQGFTLGFTGTSHKRLIARFQNHGWQVTDAAQSHLIKRL